MKKWLASHKILAFSLAACIAVILAVIITLGCMLLTTQQAFARPEILPEDWMRQSRVVMKGMQMIMQAEPGQTAEIVLAPEDAAALLKFAVNNDQIGAVFSGKEVQEGVLWTVTCNKTGLVQAACIVKTGFWKFHCILRMTAMVSYTDNTFRITPVECKAGSITIPNSIVTERIMPRILEKLEENPYIQMFHEAVESISRDENYRLVIRFYPDRAKMFAANLFRI